ncbi:hypothetical protein [Bacillus alkalicellulosilyticus]|uniref:hypothetical protein n=1 Tax=Alkalihalobacterium alkalicellulosilyticum TaxID=1912214 RepID=UPI000995FC1D|nr:hypothetical protein [Bacillus alkalicellulosilyticus]
MDRLEKRIEKLEKLFFEDKEFVNREFRKIHSILNECKQEQFTPVQTEGLESLNSLQLKIDYLTAANEQMVQQNQRLREFIEKNIERNLPLIQEEYFKALRGDS